MESSITEKITCFEDFFKFPNEEELRKKLTLFSDLEFLNQPENQTIQEFENSNSSSLNVSTSQNEKITADEEGLEEKEKLDESIKPLCLKQFRRQRRTDFFYDSKSAYSYHPNPLIYTCPLFSTFPEKFPSPVSTQSLNLPLAFSSITNSAIQFSSPIVSNKFFRRDSYLNLSSGSPGPETPISNFSPLLSSPFGMNPSFLSSPSGTIPIPISARRQSLKRSSSQANIESPSTTEFLENESEFHLAKKQKKSFENINSPTTTNMNVPPSFSLPKPLSPSSSPVLTSEEEILQGGFAREIAKALKTLGTATGAEITNWISENSDSSFNKKKKIYTVNAVLSSKKHSQLFLKETVYIDGNKRALWKLGDVGHALLSDEEDLSGTKSLDPDLESEDSESNEESNQSSDKIKEEEETESSEKSSLSLSPRRYIRKEKDKTIVKKETSELENKSPTSSKLELDKKQKEEMEDTREGNYLFTEEEERAHLASITFGGKDLDITTDEEQETDKSDDEPHSNFKKNNSKDTQVPSRQSKKEKKENEEKENTKNNEKKEEKTDELKDKKKEKSSKHHQYPSSPNNKVEGKNDLDDKDSSVLKVKEEQKNSIREEISFPHYNDTFAFSESNSHFSSSPILEKHKLLNSEESLSNINSPSFQQPHPTPQEISEETESVVQPKLLTLSSRRKTRVIEEDDEILDHQPLSIFSNSEATSPSSSALTEKNTTSNGNHSFSTPTSPPQSSSMINDTMIEKALRSLGGSASVLELNNYLESHFPKIIKNNSNWEKLIQTTLNMNKRKIFLKVEQEQQKDEDSSNIHWKLVDFSKEEEEEESRTNSLSPKEEELTEKSPESPQKQFNSSPKKRKDRISAQYQFVNLIKNALTDMEKATGADITQWIATHHSALGNSESELKSLGYSVNAILSSKKYRTLFLKDQMVCSSHSSRTLWKLSQDKKLNIKN